MNWLCMELISLICIAAAQLGDFSAKINWISSLRYVAIPIIIFCMVQSYKENKDKKRYLLKLYLITLTTSLIFNIVSCINYYSTGMFFDIGENIIGAIFQGMLLLYIIDMCVTRADRYKLKLILYIVYQIIIHIIFVGFFNPGGMLSYNWFMGPLSNIFINNFGILYLPLFVIFYYKKKYKISSTIYLLVIFLINGLNLFNRLGMGLHHHAPFVGRIYDAIMQYILQIGVYIKNNMFSFKSVAIMLPALILCLYNGKKQKSLGAGFFMTYTAIVSIFYIVSYY